MRSTLLVSDLHFAIGERESYRWNLVDQIVELIEEHRIKHIAILGDLTEHKDNHSGILINKIIDSIYRIVHKTEPCPELLIVRGNHDGTNPTVPFFRFLNVIPRVNFVIYPEIVFFGGVRVLVLPHSRNPMQDWFEIVNKKKGEYDVCFAHMTVEGAKAEHRVLKHGVERTWLKDIGVPIYSGDIHVPQKIQNLVYIGAPYPVKFGDTFIPRGLYFDRKGEEYEIEFDTIRRLLITIADRDDVNKLDDLRQGDQVKVRIQLRRSELVEWKKLSTLVKVKCRQRGVDCVSMDLQMIHDDDENSEEEEAAILVDPFDGYCERKELSKALVKVGKACLEEAKQRT